MQYQECLFPVLAYLCGSIPFGLILSNYFGNGKLREQGSKNIGATNVVRTQGKLLGFLTFFLDFLKAFLPCTFLVTNNEISNALIIFLPTFGHMFPIWLKFKGGKGIASFFGTLATLNPFLFLSTVAIWAVVFAIWRISAIAGLVSCSLSLIVARYFFPVDIYSSGVLIVLACLIFIKHRPNLKQIFDKKPIEPQDSIRETIPDNMKENAENDAKPSDNHGISDTISDTIKVSAEKEAPSGEKSLENQKIIDKQDSTDTSSSQEKREINATF